MAKYEKPKLNFISMQNNNAVADVCWATAANHQPIYLDTKGTGFTITTFPAEVGSCGATTPYNVIIEFSENVKDTERALQETRAAIEAAGGGKSVQSFKGSAFSKTIDPSWS